MGFELGYSRLLGSAPKPLSVNWPALSLNDAWRKEIVGVGLLGLLVLAELMLLAMNRLSSR